MVRVSEQRERLPKGSRGNFRFSNQSENRIVRIAML